MNQPNGSGISFFGIALDPTDDPLKIQFKHALTRNLLSGQANFANPYRALMHDLQDLLVGSDWEASGEIEVPSWLTPAPDPSELPLATPESNISFMETNGCQRHAEKVRNLVLQRMLGNIPAMIAVDHSMSFGTLSAITEICSPEDLTVLIVDSHFDAFDPSERLGLYRYAENTCPWMSSSASAHVTADSGIGQRDDLNCGNFLKQLLDKRVISPGRLILFGVSDYPDSEIKQDSRAKEYVETYLHYEQQGVTFITKEEIDKTGIDNALARLLKKIDTHHLYVSLDVDVGSLRAINAARFMNVIGLDRNQLYKTASVLGRLIRDDVELVGFDICEIETFLAGRHFKNGVIDRTFETVNDVIRLLLGHEVAYAGLDSPDKESRRHPLSYDGRANGISDVTLGETML